ncbi:MAG: glycosyltransferase family 39 protein [Candidatus Omnitrophica bacterium]|nr:glycosyltransferase family 39 protein [Candidatus Omnitrophota bacterium]MDD5591934.1 glycosyltransferase family 39 protein [Candidatus Omnitrophota bacterium]
MKIHKNIVTTFILNNKAVLILFLLALFVRLIYLFSFPQFPLDGSQYKDDLQYIGIAKNILSGNGFSYDYVNPTAARAPIYPLFLAVTYFIFGYDNHNMARILQAIIGAVSCLLIYFIAKKLYSSSIGFYAALLTGIYPSLIGYTGLLYSETLAAFLLSLAILFYLLSNKRKSFILFVITGIFSGLLILCSPKFLFLPLIFGFSICFLNKFQKGFFKYFFGLMAGAVFMLTPWTIRNFNEFGKFIPVVTGSGTTLWYSTLPEDNTEWRFDREPLLSEFRNFAHGPQGIHKYEREDFIFSAKTNEIFARKALNNIKNNPLLFIKLSVKRLFRQWLASNGNSLYPLRGKISDYFISKDYGLFLIKISLAILQICIIVFGCLGIFVDFSSNKMNIFSPLFLSIFYSSIINSIFMTQPRYQIPVLGLLFIYTALGSHWVFLKLSKTRNFLRIGSLLIINK